MIGMSESKEDMRENMLPTSDLETILETMERTTTKVAELMAPTDKPCKRGNFSLAVNTINQICTGPIVTFTVLGNQKSFKVSNCHCI